jgi:hypothetical protein
MARSNSSIPASSSRSSIGAGEQAATAADAAISRTVHITEVSGGTLVHFPSIRHLYHEHDELIILDLVQDAERPLTNPITSMLP